MCQVGAISFLQLSHFFGYFIFSYFPFTLNDISYFSVQKTYLGFSRSFSVQFSMPVELSALLTLID